MGCASSRPVAGDEQFVARPLGKLGPPAGQAANGKAGAQDVAAAADAAAIAQSPQSGHATAPTQQNGISGTADLPDRPAAAAEPPPAPPAHALQQASTASSNRNGASQADAVTHPAAAHAAALAPSSGQASSPDGAGEDGGSPSGAAAPAQLWPGAPVPPDDAARVATLRATRLLEVAGPDKRFDDVTRLATTLFQVPVAAVSLVAEDSLRFHSIQGVPGVRDSPRSSSFCAWTLLPKHATLLLIPDTLQDSRFAQLPQVTGPPQIRFYAGAPLVTSNNLRMGTLCVCDTRPRSLDAAQLNILVNLAEVVVREVERDLQIEALARSSADEAAARAQLVRAVDAAQDGVALCDASSAEWRVLYANERWTTVTGIPSDAMDGCSFWDTFTVPRRSKEATLALYNMALKKQVGFTVSHVQGPAKFGGRAMTIQFKPAASELIHSEMPLIGIPAQAAGPGTTDQLLYFVIATPHRPAPAMAQHMPTSCSSDALTQLGNAIVDSQPFDDIRLGPLLGSGSFGRVYRALWGSQPVAVKVCEVVSQGDTPHPEVLEQAEKEAALAAALRHPNIVQTLRFASRRAPPRGRLSSGTGLQSPLPRAYEAWIVQEYCSCGTLRDAIDRGSFQTRRAAGSGVDLPAVLRTAAEIAAALAYLHSKDILHGDLSGGNVLLASAKQDSRGFVAKVGDFGLSRILGGTSTIETATHGTITHMPPELLCDGRLTKQADVYAFGVLLWEMYTGEKPWAGMRQHQILFKVANLKQRPELPQAAPLELLDLYDTCTRAERSERPSIQVVLNKVQQLLDTGLAN